jgi:general transcription factor 3C polypeptide 3 (transcription factor C subunit 4)
MDCIQQAIYCFRKILYIDPNDLDALWDRSYLLKLSGNLRHVRQCLLLGGW